MSKYFDSKDLTFMEPQVKQHGQHVIMTNVHPETKTKYVNIDTRFQEEYNMQNYAFKRWSYHTQADLDNIILDIKSYGLKTIFLNIFNIWLFQYLFNCQIKI